MVMSTSTNITGSASQLKLLQFIRDSPQFNIISIYVCVHYLYYKVLVKVHVINE